MAGWHHWLDGHESEWTPWVGDGQGGLACSDSWGLKESDTTEQLNWIKLNTLIDYVLHWVFKPGAKLLTLFKQLGWLCCIQSQPIFWSHHSALIWWRCSKFMMILMSNWTELDRSILYTKTIKLEFCNSSDIQICVSVLGVGIRKYKLSRHRYHSPISMRKDNFNENRHLKGCERWL